MPQLHVAGDAGERLLRGGHQSLRRGRRLRRGQRGERRAGGAGDVNHTAFGQLAVDYAYSHGVLVVASQADESAGHHNFPAALNHTMLVNSVTRSS